MWLCQDNCDYWEYSWHRQVLSNLFIWRFSSFGGIYLCLRFTRMDICDFYTLCDDAFYCQTVLHFLFSVFVITIETASLHYIVEKSKILHTFTRFCGTRLNPDLIWSIVMGIVIVIISILVTKLLPRFNLSKNAEQ